MESSDAALQRLQYGSQSNTSGSVLDNLNAALGRLQSEAAANAAATAPLAGSSSNQAAADDSTHAASAQAAASTQAAAWPAGSVPHAALAFSPQDTWEQRSWKQATANRAAREVLQGASASWIRDEANENMRHQVQALQAENKRLQEESLQADSKRARAEAAAEAAAQAAVAAANTAEHFVRSWDGGGGGGGYDGEGGGDSWRNWTGGEWRWSERHGWLWRQETEENNAWYWVHDHACWMRRDQLYDQRGERRGRFQKYELARAAAKNRLSSSDFTRWCHHNHKAPDEVFMEVT